MVAKVRERLAISKQDAQKFYVERFNLRKLSELQVRKQYQIKVSNRFAALYIFNHSQDINRVWENIKENIKTSAKESLGLHELKQHKPWYDEECLRFLEQRKRAKMQWLQDPNQSNVDYINTVKPEASRHFINKKRIIRKIKLMNLKLTVRSKISETCLETSMTLRRVTNLDLIQ